MRYLGLFRAAMKTLGVVFGAGLVVVALAPMAESDQGQAALADPFSVAGGPFVGEWYAHGERLTINADGNAVETTASGRMYFRFVFVQGPPSQPDTTAYGSRPDGGYATATLVDGGRGLTLSVAGGDDGFPFCKIVDGRKLNPANCGA